MTPILPRCFLGLAVLLAGACADGESAPRSVVWIEVDTLRADALGCYGNEEHGESGALPTPAIDGLAREGLLFERAYSAAPWTVPSLVTQLTGRWPWEHGALRLLQPVPGGDPNLPERFRAAGWRTGAVMTNFVVQQRLGFDRGFEVWDQDLATGHEGSSAPEAVARMLEIADRLAERPGKGLFLFLLLFEPHFRYEQHGGLRFGPGFSSGAAYRGELTGQEELADLRARREELTDEDVAFLRGCYQSEVAAVDRAIGDYLAGLRERRMLDKALVVLTADHGEELMDHGWIGHTRTLHDELVRVPLVLRLPRELLRGRPGQRIEFPVSQVDLGATVLDLSGIEAGLGEGRSFASTALAGEKPARRYLFLHTDFEPPLKSEEALEKRALLWGVFDAEEHQKWIVDRHPDHLHEGRPQTYWYDLDHDPGEESNLVESAPPPERLFLLPELDPSHQLEGANAPKDGGASGERP